MSGLRSILNYQTGGAIRRFQTGGNVTQGDLEQFQALVASGNFPQAAALAASLKIPPDVTAAYVNANAANLNLPSGFQVSGENIAAITPQPAAPSPITITAPTFTPVYTPPAAPIKPQPNVSSPSSISIGGVNTTPGVNTTVKRFNELINIGTPQSFQLAANLAKSEKFTDEQTATYLNQNFPQFGGNVNADLVAAARSGTLTEQNLLNDFDDRMARGDFTGASNVVKQAAGIFGDDVYGVVADRLNKSPLYTGLRENVGGAVYTRKNIFDFVNPPSGEGAAGVGGAPGRDAGGAGAGGANVPTPGGDAGAGGGGGRSDTTLPASRPPVPAAAPDTFRFAAPQRGIAALRGPAYMSSLLEMPAGATNMTSAFGGSGIGAAGIRDAAGKFLNAEMAAGRVSGPDDPKFQAQIAGFMDRMNVSPAEYAAAFGAGRGGVQSLYDAVRPQGVFATPQARPQAQPFTLQTGATFAPPIQPLAFEGSTDPKLRAQVITNYLYPGGKQTNVSAADLANAMGQYGVTMSDIMGIKPPPSATPTTAAKPAPAPVNDFGGARAGGLVTYKEGGMPKHTAKEAGSQFNMSEFLDKQGRLVGGFSKPIRDQYGNITNYEFVPYQSNVVFNPELRKAEARGMSEEEREAARRGLIVRQGTTGVDPYRGGLAGIEVREPTMRERPQYYSYAQGGLASLAENLADKGRGGDSMLVHMSPEEVQGLRGLAVHMGGDLTINPQTGLPEAKLLKKLLPILPFIPGIGQVLGPIAQALGPIGKAASAFASASPLLAKSIASGIIGGFTAPGKGFNFKEGLKTGIGAFAGGKLFETLSAMGAPGGSGPVSGAPPSMGPVDPTSGGVTSAMVGVSGPQVEGGFGNFVENVTPFTPAGQAPITGPSSAPIEGVGVNAPDPTLGSGLRSLAEGAVDATTGAIARNPKEALLLGSMGLSAYQSKQEQEKFGAAQAAKEREEEERRRQYEELFSRTLGRVPMAAGGGLVAMAGGGMSTFEYGGTTAPTGEPRMVQGAGDGMSDNIPANIEGVQEARLANDEFVVPADVVADIGNGSSSAGAKKLYAMMDRIRKARHGTTEQPPEIDAERLMPA